MSPGPILEKNWMELVIDYAQKHFGISDEDFEMVWNKFVYNVGRPDIDFLDYIIPLIEDEGKKEQLEEKMDSIKSNIL